MPVEVRYNLHKMELTERLKEYIESRVTKLDKYLDVLEEATVVLTHAQSARSADDRQVAQLTVRGKGVMLRAEERTSDMFASIDAVLAKVHRQIDRYKGRRWRARGDGRTMAEALSEGGETPEEEERELIVRRKRFQMMPMSEEEAIEQMALLGHEDFFVFLNEDSSEVNVLYRRRDGSFGLIESEVG